MRALLRAGAFALTVATSITAAAPASAATIIGGGTSVTVTAASVLAGLGISFAPFGTASAVTNTAGQPVATFLITGGERNDSTGALRVLHNGSGLTFSASGGRTLSVANFIVDTAAGTVTANATANGAGLGSVPLFTIGSGLTLAFTSQAASAFTSVFSAPNLTGQQFGVADVNFVLAPSVAGVPEPATWAMMVLGFGAMGQVLRRRAKAAPRIRFAA